MNEKSNSLKNDGKADKKQEALQLAKTYLQTLGFNGFSFQTIADSLGIRKASLHYYFSSKEEMGLELMKDYENAYKLWSAKVSELSAAQKLEKLVSMFLKMSEQGQYICPTGVLTSDYNTLPAKMKKKVKEFHFIQREWIIETLEQGKKERTFRKDLDTKITADLIMATLQGGLQLMRLRGEKDIVKKMCHTVFESFYA